MEFKNKIIIENGEASECCGSSSQTSDGVLSQAPGMTRTHTKAGNEWTMIKDKDFDYSVFRKVTRSVCSLLCFKGEVTSEEEYSYEYCNNAMSLVDDSPVDDLESLMASNSDSEFDDLPLGCEAYHLYNMRWIPVDDIDLEQYEEEISEELSEDEEEESNLDWASEDSFWTDEEEPDEEEVNRLMAMKWVDLDELAFPPSAEIDEDDLCLTEGDEMVQDILMLQTSGPTQYVAIRERKFEWYKDHILYRPLESCTWTKVLEKKFEMMPYMCSKYVYYEKVLGREKLASVNDACLMGSCRKGTPEYYSDQLWLTRRYRQQWLDACERAELLLCITQGDERYIEDLMITQGDQNDLEESESLSKFGNVTFVDERPVEAVPSHLNGDQNLMEEHADISETPWTLRQLLEREQYIETVTWKVGDMGNLATLAFPLALIRPDSVTENQLRLCGFLRSAVEVRIVMNGNKFMMGRVLAHVEPIQFSVDSNSHDLVAYPNFPHVFLDASVSNSAVLHIPYCSILSYMSQRAGSMEDDSINSIGRLYVDVFNALQAPEGGVQRLSITIYARFVKPVLQQTTHTIMKFGYSDGFVTQGGEEMPIINRAVQPPCHGETSDNTIMLSLDKTGGRPADAQTKEGDDFNLMSALQVPGLIQQTFWQTSEAESSVIFAFPVSPNYIGPVNVSIAVGKGAVYRPTFLNYISRCFAYWSGDIMVKIQIIGNAFASGRLMHSFDPTWTSGEGHNIDLQDASNYNCVIQDIQEQQEIVIRIPYMSIRPYLRCDYWKITENFNDPTDLERIGQSYMGYFRTSVLNSLVMPAQMAQRVEINYYLYAAPNFSLRVPVSLQPLDVDQGDNDKRYPREPVYPMFPYASESICYDNRDYIRVTWSEGYRLYTASLIKNAANWWECAPVPGKGEIDEVFHWCYKARQLAEYVKKAETSQQARLMKSLGSFGPNFMALPEKEEECLTEGLENFVSSRKAPELQPIVMTKGNRDQNAPEIEKNALGTFLHRYYPLIIMNPRQALTGFTLIQVPVNPAFIPPFRNPIMKTLAPVPMINQLAWISRMYGFWSGSLRYKFIYPNTETEVYVAYVPQDNLEYRINSGVSPQDVQSAMCYAGTIAVSHLQGALEVTVPFSSPYNQCMVNVKGGHYDARNQNGTLLFYMRNRLIQQHVQIPAVSIFISAGDDFKLNWLMTPPRVFDPLIAFNCNPDERRELGWSEPHRNLGDWGNVTRSPQKCGFREIDKIAEMALCKGEPQMTTQGLGDVLTEIATPFSFMFNLNNAARSLPGQIEKFNQNIEETKEALTQMTTKTGSFMDKAEQYLELAASTILAGNVIRSFSKVCANPSTGNLIDLALSAATLLGYNVRKQLLNCLNLVLNCFDKKEQPQAQAMNEAILDVVEENEFILTKCIAVLGTILYAYIFDCIPDFGKFKNWIKEFLNEEPVAQGFDLRGAHFGYLGLSALSKVFDNLVRYAKMFVDWLLARDSPETLLARKAEAIRERVLTLIRNLDELDNEVEILRALADPLVHNRFYGLMSEVRELTEMYMKGKMDVRVGQILTECRSRVKTLIQRLEREKPTHGWRFDPYVVCIYGPTGTGKTAIMREVSKVLAEVMDIPEYNRVFNKTINDDFWSGYTGQNIVHWDEFGQNAQKDANVAEFIELRGNDPHKLNMAALEEKGAYFTSKAIVMTTNVPYLSFSTVIRDKNAYLRRRHFMLGMQHQPGFDANVLQNQAGFDPEFQHCRFECGDNMTQNNATGPFDKREILALLREEATAWYNKQLAMYEEYKRDSGLTILPRGAVPILEPVNFSANTEVRELLQVSDVVPPLVEVEDSAGRHFTVAASENETQQMCVIQGDEEDEMCQLLNSRKRRQTEGYAYCRLSYDLSACSEDELSRNYIDKAAFCYVAVPNLAKAKMSLAEWGKAKVMQLYTRACKIFDDLKGKIVNIYEKYPKLIIVTAALGMLTSVAATYLLIRSEDPEVEEKKEKEPTTSWEPLPEQAYDVHQRKMAVRLVKAENQNYDAAQVKLKAMRLIQAENQQYDVQQKKAGLKLVRAEGNDDQNSTDIRKVVHPNLVVVGWAKGSTKATCLRGLHVCGQVLLLPYHFFNGATPGDKFILAHRLNPIYVEYEVQKMARLDDKDWCLYDCGARFEPRRNISKYFIRESNLGKLSQVNSLLCNIDFDGVFVIQKGVAKAVVNFRYKDGFTHEQYIQKGWATNFSTEPGDCGSFLIAMTPAIPAPGKILGIHTAGYVKRSEGFTVLITHEQIEAALTKLQPQVQGFPVPKEIDRTEEGALKIKCVPEGDYSIYGSMPNKMAPAQPVKTDFVETPFPEELIQEIPNSKKPAHLHPFVNAEGLRVSPLKNALSKYGKATIPFPQRNVLKVKKHLVNMFQNVFKNTEKRLFTEKEAIVGIPGMDFADRLNMKSSPGWPYQVLNKKEPGKFYLFDEDGNVVNQELKERLADRLSKAKIGQRVPSLWRDCLKDELRPNAKVDEGKTRLFTIAPVDYTIIVRQYFMDFAINFYSESCNFFSAVGINPESYEWTKLYNYLAECGNNCIAGDYSSFDGTLMAELMDSVADIINEWYADGAENALVRKVLINEMIHTMQLVENCVYATHQGNPSGNPLTVIINTIVNYMYLSLVFLEIYPEANLDSFSKNIRAICYGDDVLITVKEIYNKFNFNNIKRVLEQHGLGFTTDMKTNEAAPDFVELDSVTFLKRGFRTDVEFGKQFKLPTMAKETLYSYFHWVRKSEMMEEQLQENMRSSLAFAAFHGRTFYESFHQKWVDCFKACDLSPICITFEEQVDAFLVAANAAQFVGAERQFFDNITEGEDVVIDPGVNKWVLFWNFLKGLGWGVAVYYIYQLMKFNEKQRKKVSQAMRIERTDRWAICMPSGEGKSTLAKKFPKYFIDHDDLILFKGEYPAFELFMNQRLADRGIARSQIADLPLARRVSLAVDMQMWFGEWVRKEDVDVRDRRILLTHSPQNTERSIAAVILNPEPTGVRNNLAGRVALERDPRVEYLTFDKKEERCLKLVQEHEKEVFEEKAFIFEIERFVGHFTSRLST